MKVKVSPRWRLLATAAPLALVTSLLTLTSPATSATSATAATSATSATSADGLRPATGLPLVPMAQIQVNGDYSDLFFVSPSGFQIQLWSNASGNWVKSTLGPGEGAETNTGISAGQQANGDISVYYVGRDGQIYNWLYTSSTGWLNGSIGQNLAEPAAPGSSVTEIQQSNGDQNVYYVGKNKQLWVWAFNGEHWANSQLGDGEAARPASGLASDLQANGFQQVFYAGANGQIYNWLLAGTEGWLNGAIGHGAAAATGTGVADVAQSNGDQNVYYVGVNQQVYTWAYTEHWSNSELGGGPASAEVETYCDQLTALQQSNGDETVYYTGASGQMFNWLYSGGTWTNGEISQSGETVDANSAIVSWANPTVNDQYVYYFGTTGKVYEWYYDTENWQNLAL
jgi:hypothetical protein